MTEIVKRHRESADCLPRERVREYLASSKARSVQATMLPDPARGNLDPSITLGCYFHCLVGAYRPILLFSCVALD